MTIKIGKFANNQTQSKFINLVYHNENGKVYSIKIPFGRFILLTIGA